MQLSFESLQFSPRYGADVPLPAVVEAVAEGGGHMIGIDHWLVASFVEQGGSIAGVGRMVAEAGLTCSSVGALSIGADGHATIERAKGLAELAEALDAPVCVAAVGADVENPTAAATIETFAGCAEIFAAGSVRLAVEFTPYLPLRTISDTCTICEAIGWSQAGVLLDSWHTLIGGQLGAVATLLAENVAAVQFNDARVPLARALEDETRNHRCLPGEGNLDLVAFADAVRATGYDGVVASEVLSAAVRAGSVNVFARDVQVAMALYWPTDPYAHKPLQDQSHRG